MIRALLALPLAGAITAPPQFRASVDVVRIEALVLDRGRPVAGLGAGDFTVTDNGAVQTISVRALARQPIDVAIALDVSSSVRGDRLERLRQAAGALVGLLTPQDRATLVTFDHQVTLGPRDVNPHALDARLAAIAAGGRTSLIDAVTTALVWGGGRERPMLDPRVQRRTRHVELDAHRSGAGAGAVERRRRRRGRHRRAAADEHDTHRFRRHPAPHSRRTSGSSPIWPRRPADASATARRGPASPARSATPSSSSAAATRSPTPRPARSRAGTPSTCACPAGAAPASTPGAAISGDERFERP